MTGDRASLDRTPLRASLQVLPRAVPRHVQQLRAPCLSPRLVTSLDMKQAESMLARLSSPLRTIFFIASGFFFCPTRACTGRTYRRCLLRVEYHRSFSLCVCRTANVFDKVLGVVSMGNSSKFPFIVGRAQYIFTASMTQADAPSEGLSR